MATEAQMAANRANAKKSTGPRTEGGKAKARLNALRHGLAAEQVLTFDEDAAEFARFAGEMEEALAPEGAAELALCERITMGNWRLKRVWRQEAAALNKHALAAMHERAREEMYEVVLAELRANPPPEEERKKMWPPFDAGVEARRIVWGLSEAALEEAALGARAAARAEGEAAGEGREPEAELAGDDALAEAAQKPDQPLWPEHEMTALSRYEASIERALARASATLDKLQQRRKSEAEPAGKAEPSPPLSRQQRRAAARGAADKGKSAERTQFAGPPAAPRQPQNGGHGAAPPA